MSTKNSLFPALALAAVTLGISACASAPTEEGAVAAVDVDRVVCRREADTGSRLPKKTCKKQCEWDLIAEENERIRRSLRRGSTATGNYSDGSQ